MKPVDNPDTSSLQLHVHFPLCRKSTPTHERFIPLFRDDEVARAVRCAHHCVVINQHTGAAMKRLSSLKRLP